MKRRKVSEIQVKPSVTFDEAVELPDFSKLVPSYSHRSVTDSCASSAGSYSDTTRIIFNSVYKYNEWGTYDRDNYCMVPVILPSMVSGSKTYKLNNDTLHNSILKVSKIFGLKYDKSLWTHTIDDSNGNHISFAKIVIDSCEDDSQNSEIGNLIPFVDLLSLGRCNCDGDSSESLTLPSMMYDNESLKFISPVDNIGLVTDIIIDDYSHIWEDVWDMETLATASSGGYIIHDPSDSSSSGTVIYGNVFIGVLTESPNGGVGAAKVKHIKIGSDGSWKTTGSSIKVVCPHLS